MMGISTSNMFSYRQNVEQVVSQAAIHLHNSLGPIGTALFDRHGALVFNNNALRYVNEKTLVSLVADCAIAAHGSAELCTGNGITARAIALDSQHIFVVVGPKLEERALDAVDGFVTSLRAMLPPPPGSAAVSPTGN